MLAFWKPKQEFQAKVMVDSIKRLWRIHATEAERKRPPGSAIRKKVMAETFQGIRDRSQIAVWS